MQFTSHSTGDDPLGLVEKLQAFADAYWLPDHVTPDQAEAIILDAFRRKVAGELELLGVEGN